MRPSLRFHSHAAIWCCAIGCAAPSPAAEPPRPTMRTLAPSAVARPPADHELVDARAAFQRRFGEMLAGISTSAAANAAAAQLLDAAATEDDRRIKWLMLSESRELAAAAGNAAGVEKSLVAASAEFTFDFLGEEYKTLVGIPLRPLDAARAAALATVAARLADRAEADGRRDVAINAQTLAMRGWERAGAIDAARKAQAEVRRLDPGRIPGRR